MSARKKKVLFLIHTLQVGGAEKILVDLVNSLDPAKFDITVMTILNIGALRKKLAKHIQYSSAITIKFLQDKASTDESVAGALGSSRLKKIAESFYSFLWRHCNAEKFYKKHIHEKYDVEVAFLEGISTKIIGASNNPESIKLAWIHTDLNANGKKMASFFKNSQQATNTLNKFNRIICVSSRIKKSLLAKYKVKATTDILFNFIDSDKIKRASKKQLSIAKDKFTFCSVGRLSSVKGYERLINASSKLSKDGYDFQTWIIGSGEDKNALERQIRANHLSNIKLLGQKNNPYPYINASDVFISTSKAEGFSTVLSEAVVLEKPIIATNCSGTDDILGANSEYGLVCNNSEESIYLAMKSMLDRPGILKKYQSAVKKRVELFDRNNSIIKIENMLMGVLQ